MFAYNGIALSSLLFSRLCCHPNHSISLAKFLLPFSQSDIHFNLAFAMYNCAQPLNLTLYIPYNQHYHRQYHEREIFALLKT